MLKVIFGLIKYGTFVANHWDSKKFKSDLWMKSRKFKDIWCFGLFFEVFREHKKFVIECLGAI